MPPCLLIYAWCREPRDRESIFRSRCLFEWNSKILSRSQRADKASNKNVVQKGQNRHASNQITRTWAACVAAGCARPPIDGADRVLQAVRNSLQSHDIDRDIWGQDHDLEWPSIDFSRRLIFVKKLLTVKVSNFSALHEETENFRQVRLMNLRNTFHMKRLSPYFLS